MRRNAGRASGDSEKENAGHLFRQEEDSHAPKNSWTRPRSLGQNQSLSGIMTMERTQTMLRRTVLKAVSAATLAAGLGLVAERARAQSEGSRRRILVAYFSRSGNTALVARKIALRRQGDLFEIRPAEAYPEDYEETVAQAEREREVGYQPPLAGTVPGIADYGTVFLGFPVWGMTTPPVVRSFLSQHDFSGRTIVPFITHGGYGVGSSLDVVAGHAPDARLVEGFSMEGEQERRVVDRVGDWLGDLQLAE